jgi:serine/threonine-protein kinase
MGLRTDRPVHAPNGAAFRDETIVALHAAGYEVDEPVAVSPSGILLRATDRRRHRIVAIKLIELGRAHRDHVQRVVDDVQALAAVQHPHVVPVLDSGVVGDRQLYLVMPWIDGATMRRRLGEHGRLAIAETLRLGIDVADALVAMHRHHLVHRELTPSHILFDGTRATLIDLGRACAAHPALRVGLADAPAPPDDAEAFTPLLHDSTAYMSPEQWVTGGIVDGRTDVYALGCLLYECLAGRAPFTRSLLASRHDDIHRWTDAPDGSDALDGGATAHLRVPPSVRAIRDDVPARLDKLLRRAMAPDRDQRVPSALALRESLLQLQAECLRAVDGRRRRRRVIATAAAALALPAAVAALGVWR